MRSQPVGSGQSILASQIDSIRLDAQAAGSLLAHQQLGALTLGTLPTNGQVIPIIINGTTITITAVSAIGSTPNNVLIPGTAAGFAANIFNFLIRPDVTNTNQVAANSTNQALIQYLGYALVGTTITIYSLNNAQNAPLASLSFGSITVTSGSWTANTMKIYIEPGLFYIGITQVVFAGASTAAFVAPTSHPRIDIVTIDSSGTLLITQGVESASPVAPTYPTGKLVICEVMNVVGETTIYDNSNQQSGQGYISKDARGYSSVFYIADNSQIAPGVIQASNLANAGTCATASIVMFAASSAPAGWLLCDGSAVSRTTYATLLAAVGTTYGIGDGSTTFNIPNFQANLPAGYKSGDANFGTLGQTGGAKTTTFTPNVTGSPVGGNNQVNNVGSGSSTPLVSVAGASTTINILPPYITLNFIIKT